MNAAAVVGSMILSILLGSWAILDEIQKYTPDDISDRRYCAFLIGWGVFTVSAIGSAVNGFW
ncbi:MAG: hypothetical protein AB9917_16430 [Negativicutes bacterium]